MTLTIEKRREMTDGLLAIEFEDGHNYTLQEIEDMDDDELQEAFKEEMSDAASDTEVDLEECFVCGEMKVCDYADEETGKSVCQECAEEAEEGDEEEETDSKEDSDDSDSDDDDQEFEDED